MDIIAPTLHKALGLTELPSWNLNSAEAKILPAYHDGLYVVTIASHFGETPAVLWDDKTLIRAMGELNRDVQWPELNYLLLDSPPSSSSFMQALYDCLDDLYGVVLVFQPTDIAAADLLRTFDFVRIKKVPIVGLISNMNYCISPKGEEFWPFLSPRIDLDKVCQQYGIPLLGSVPLTPSQDRIDMEFDRVVERMEGSRPLRLADDMAMRIYKAIKRRAIKALVRRL